MTPTSLLRGVCAWYYTCQTSNYNIHLGEYYSMKERKYLYINGPLMWQNEPVKPHVKMQFGFRTMLRTDDEVLQHVRHVKVWCGKGCVCTCECALCRTAEDQ